MYFVFLGLLFWFFNSPILASENNFGLHLTQPEDIHSAHKIINSSGGDWGWSTIVIRSDQLDRQTWQDFFDNCRKLHIIPIIRIASTMDTEYWKKPTSDDVNRIAEFLNSLNWPTKTRHVILFNEINHATEWGGEVNIKEFADISIYASKKFKELNPDFYIISSAIDLASPEKPPKFKSAPNVYREIYNYNKEYFNAIDAIGSHSYPNHGFIGTPNDTGQHSIRGYKWELDFIKSLGVGKTFDVFITETGWPHREGESRKNNFYQTKTTAKFLETAFSIWSKDDRVQAITPFIYNYPYPPFDHFSWVDKDNNLYPDYNRIIEMGKEENDPEQITQFEIVNISLPFLIFNQKDQFGSITLKNTGQSIWGETNFCLEPQASSGITLDTLCTPDAHFIYPGNQVTLDFKFVINSDKDLDGNDYLKWKDTPEFEIAPINPTATIYRPKTGIKDKLSNFFVSLFI